MKKRSLEHDPDDNSVVIGVLGDAFSLREGETSLSAGHAEYYNDAEFSEQPRVACEKFKDFLTIKKSDRFVVGEVARIKNACADFGQKVRIVTDPVPKHLAHASVRQFKDDKSELLDLLASEAWAEIVSI